jgi:hypothetical protein
MLLGIGSAGKLCAATAGQAVDTTASWSEFCNDWPWSDGSFVRDKLLESQKVGDSPKAMTMILFIAESRTMMAEFDVPALLEPLDSRVRGALVSLRGKLVGTVFPYLWDRFAGPMLRTAIGKEVTGCHLDTVMTTTHEAVRDESIQKVLPLLLRGGKDQYMYAALTKDVRCLSTTSILFQ